MKTITNKDEALKIMYNILRNSCNEYRLVDKSSHTVTYINEDSGMEYTISDHNFGFEIRTRNVD